MNAPIAPSTRPRYSVILTQARPHGQYDFVGASDFVQYYEIEDNQRPLSQHNYRAIACGISREIAGIIVEVLNNITT